MRRRLTAPHLRRGIAMVVPVVAAVLAFVPVANAATTQPVVYTPTDTASLQTDIGLADGQPQGTLSIIQLCAGCQYTPTAQLPLNGNIEITGPPTYQDSTTLPDVQINGGTVFNLSPAQPLFSITGSPSSPTNVLFKGFDVASGGNGQGVGAIQDTGSTVELDNMGVTGSLGSALTTAGAANVTITNSTIGGGVSDGVENTQGSGNVTLINDTFAYGATGAISGPNIASYNTIFFHNKQASGNGACPIGVQSGDTFAGDYADDTSCGGSSTGANGITVPTRWLASTVGQIQGNGGPSDSVVLTSTAPPVGHGLAQYCATGDQRFFLYTKGSSGTCDVGSTQTTGTQDGSTSGPVCTVHSVFESNTSGTPSTMTVYSSEPSGLGIGPDGINYTITNNGSVMYGVNGSTWFNAPISPPIAADPSYPSNGNYSVTAQKPATDVGPGAVGDTKWSYYQTDWLGNTSYCN